MKNKKTYKVEIEVSDEPLEYGLFTAKDEEGREDTMVRLKDLEALTSDRRELLLGKGAVLQKKFGAHSWEQALTIRNYILNFEPYKPQNWSKVNEQD